MHVSVEPLPDIFLHRPAPGVLIRLKENFGLYVDGELKAVDDDKALLEHVAAGLIDNKDK